MSASGRVAVTTASCGWGTPPLPSTKHVPRPRATVPSPLSIRPSPALGGLQRARVQEHNAWALTSEGSVEVRDPAVRRVLHRAPPRRVSVRLGTWPVAIARRGRKNVLLRAPLLNTAVRSRCVASVSSENSSKASLSPDDTRLDSGTPH